MRKYCFLLLICITSCSITSSAADASRLFDSLRTKVLSVRDYKADVTMNINVTYMRIPKLDGTLYFKSPDKMRLERHGGLSILPKKNVNLTLSNLLPSGNVTVIDMGIATINNKKARVLKVIPEDEKSDIVLTKLWVDETDLLALRTETTTRNDGTVIMDLEFGNYKAYGLPDKVTIYMNLKDYKLPKGVTMDYDQQETKPVKESKGGQKGTITINYLSYDINKGISDNMFTDGKKSDNN